MTYCKIGTSLCCICNVFDEMNVALHSYIVVPVVLRCVVLYDVVFCCDMSCNVVLRWVKLALNHLWFWCRIVLPCGVLP